LNSAIKTIPLRTATPKSAMKPTPAEILKFILEAKETTRLQLPKAEWQRKLVIRILQN
jgi:hypothetical protein